MGKTLLTDDQAERLRELLEELHESPSRIAELTSPEELHAIACIWNWDDSATCDVLGQIVAHPLCDLGTASMIFGEGDLLELLKNESEADFVESYPGELEEEKAFFRLALSILASANKEGFSSQRIAMPGISTGAYSSDIKHPLPEILQQKTPGEEYDYPRNVWM